MGVDFRVENEPRYVVTGTVKDWRGERTFDGEQMEHHEIASLFEDPPESIDIRVQAVALEPPLPAEAAALHVGMPYSAFGRLRKKLAATIGLDLEMMWGFRPSAIRIAEIRGLPKTAAARAPDYHAWEDEQQQWWDERARQWDTVDSGLVPFLYHSDCDGDLSIEECRRVAPALADAISRMPDEEVPEGYVTDKDKARALLEMIEAAGRYERRLLFR